MDWEALARELGTLMDTGEHSSVHDAQHALTHILGEQAIIDAVEHYVAFRLGRELSRMVLMLLRPSLAMERCYQIFREDTNSERRWTAVELLKWTSDGRVLPWVTEFLADPEVGVQNAGIEVLDQLTFCHYVDEADAEPFLQIGARHPNPHVRRITGLIWRFLEDSTLEQSSRYSQKPYPSA